MPRRSKPLKIGEDDTPVSEQFETVAAELRVLRDVLSELREQLHWIATNGIPRWEPSIDDRHASKSAPVLAAPERPKPPNPQSPEAELVQDIIERLETGIASIATDQLALFVDALDEVRDELVAALKRDRQRPLAFDEPHDEAPVAPPAVLDNDTAQPEVRAEPPSAAPAAVNPENRQPVLTDPFETRHPRPPSFASSSAQRSLFDLPRSAAVPLTLFEPGDAVMVREFNVDGTDGFGEVVTVDDAYNTATVELIPSEEHVTVSQDLLMKIEPDPLAYGPTLDRPDSDSNTATPHS